MQLAAKIRAELSRRRAERSARRRLSAELAAFTSAADRVELEQVLDRHSSEEAREVRGILLRQDAVRL
ncbi:hypothetical protein ACWEOZ_24695 [Actinoplanes sp. NPDC004185]